MTAIKRKGDYLTEEQRRTAIKEIVDYFTTERDQDIGVIAAEEILDFVLSTVGDNIRNFTLDEAKNIIRSGCDNIEVNLDLAKS